VTSAPGLLVGFAPVMLFLAGLVFMDSYKLVRRGAIALALLAGAGAALAAFGIHLLVLGPLHVGETTLRHTIAPVVEETLKALYVLWLVRAEKVGFMVDAGIQGFAVGTGFALVENVYYASAIGAGSLPLWLVRGLGTAVMHGATTAVVGILAKDLADRSGGRSLAPFLPGLVLAMVVHALFNRLTINPLLTTAVLLVTMPLLLFVVFERSEKATRDWLGTGMDHEVELLEQVLGGEIAETRIGAYLETLKSRFPGPMVGDMLCLLRIHLELSLRAKGMLIARAAGVAVEPDEHVRANLAEMAWLEKAIGPTGRMAILPFMKTSSRDLWQLYTLTR
jgi:RsiW-degrading membrane proteinase PrsW (M82 family)